MGEENEYVGNGFNKCGNAASDQLMAARSAEEGRTGGARQPQDKNLPNNQEWRPWERKRGKQVCLSCGASGARAWWCVVGAWLRREVRHVCVLLRT